MPYPLGAIPSPPDKRDFPAHAFLPAKMEAFPDEYDLPVTIPVYDQGAYGMCVDFSLRSLKELQEYVERGIHTQYGSGYLYGNRGPDDYKGEGMQPREALQTLLKSGIPTASVYNVVGDYPTCARYYEEHHVDEVAFPQRIKSYVRCASDDEVMGALLHLKSPVAIVIAVTPRFSYLIPPNGRVYVEADEDVQKNLQGYHQMYVRGWKRDEYLWWHVVNSWTAGWGANGECWIRSDDPRIGEMWAVTDVVARGKKVSMKIGAPSIVVQETGDDGQTSTVIQQSDVAPFVQNDRTFVPVRVLAEALGCSVTWDEATQTVTILQFK